MTKDEALCRFGTHVVELAREYYETDFDKYLFEEDAGVNGIPASEFDQYERLLRAQRNYYAEKAIENPIPGYYWIAREDGMTIGGMRQWIAFFDGVVWSFCGQKEEARDLADVGVKLIRKVTP